MRDQLSFILNGETQRLRGIDPTTTLLQFLRRTKRLTGTKEGCAEGDCGACTVVVGERHGEKIVHRAVNACILFLPMLEGRSVTTVEHLAGPGGALHPVQEAMVNTNGSQCGFCTPGFVMSLYAMYLGAQEDVSVDDALAGNLCRCTGYGPIVIAAKEMGTYPRPATDAERLAREDAGLAAIAHDETVALDYERAALLFAGTPRRLRRNL